MSNSKKQNQNRIKQAENGTWLFCFKFRSEKYFQNNFQTREQAEIAIKLQYEVLGLNKHGIKVYENKLIEKGIYLMQSGKYRAFMWQGKKTVTEIFSELQQARDFRDTEYQKRIDANEPQKPRVCKPKPLKPLKIKVSKPKEAKPNIFFCDKKAQAKRAVMKKYNLNKGIAELNAGMDKIAKIMPTIPELMAIAKKQRNPRQYYLQQLRDGVYRG